MAITKRFASETYVTEQTSGIQTQLNNKQDALNFIPIQQGGGSGQSSNKIKIGWDNSSKLLYDIDDGVGIGTFASESWVSTQIQSSIKATWEASY